MELLWHIIIVFYFNLSGQDFYCNHITSSREFSVGMSLSLQERRFNCGAHNWEWRDAAPAKAD